MTYEIVKSEMAHINTHDKYFDIEVQNKKYPSCYQYNVLIMLAKRLIKKEEEKQELVSSCKNRWNLDKQLAEKIINA